MARSSLAPGFRFHPTDAELVMYYLKRKLLGKKFIVDAIAEVNIYDYSPCDLPDHSNLRSRDLEWFFFCPKSIKYLSGPRLNRATATGFWKATGKDRSVEYKQRTVAMIKTLVFHLGHAPKGERTDWVMHEYRMKDEQLATAGIVQDMYVLCKIFKKSGAGPKNGAQYGAPFVEEEWDDDVVSGSKSPAVIDPDGATNTRNYKQNSSATMNMTVPQSTYGLSLTEPSSSIVTSSNERCVDVPANDDAMITVEDIASIMGGSAEDLNDDNKNELVEVANEKKVKSAIPNENDGIFDDLMNLINLEDLNEVPSDMFNIDGAGYMLDTVLTADDLGVDLNDLVNLNNLEDLNEVASDMFKVDRADYMLDTVLAADDLEVGLRDFYVD